MAACVNGLSSSLSRMVNAGNSEELGSNFSSTYFSLSAYTSRFRKAEATALAITAVIATKNGDYMRRKFAIGLGSPFAINKATKDSTGVQIQSVVKLLYGLLW